MADTVCTPMYVMSLRALLHRATSVPHPSVRVRWDSSVLDTRSTSGVEIYKIRYVKFFSEKKFQDRNIERGRDSHGKCIVPTRYCSSKVASEYIENVQKVFLFLRISSSRYFYFVNPLNWKH